jgi:Zn-finger nucleic acid-binding protein
MDPRTPVALACPKCGASMRLIERSGVHIDQCQECRGIFLDRGELDRLLDLEAAGTSRAMAGPPTAIDRGPAWDDDDRWDDRGRRRPDRRGGFLSDLFQGFDD